MLRLMTGCKTSSWYVQILTPDEFLLLKNKNRLLTYLLLIMLALFVVSVQLYLNDLGRIIFTYFVFVDDEWPSQVWSEI